MSTVAWISLTPADIDSRLSAAERSALARATGDAAELILADVLAGIEATVRGYIRARRDAIMAPSGIPPSLRDTALDLAVPAYSTRAGGILLDPKGARAKARDDALKRLEDVAAGTFRVETPANPHSATGSATPLPAIKVPESIL
ncbi:MAG: DUF1320 domain-containing protein [Porticoccaceae bacterium]|nr:DUF1320 domain-containing protein [Porticoccaceae bacterium]